MRPNIEFLVMAYFIALFIDWVFQAQWQALNKSKWARSDDQHLSASALLSHSTVYAFITVVVLTLLGMIHGIYIVTVFMILFISHVIIDTRIPVKWILRAKGMTEEQLKDPLLGFMHIGIDHRLHEMVLLILSFYIPMR